MRDNDYYKLIKYMKNVFNIEKQLVFVKDGSSIVARYISFSMVLQLSVIKCSQ